MTLGVLGAVALGGRPAAAAVQPPSELPARAWVLVDAADGEVLAAHEAATSYSIASTTKLMTALVARRELRLGQTVVAPPYAALPAESVLGLQAGERIEVRDLLYGLLLASGNDAAAALAQASAGSEDAFVAEMNATARRLGLDDTSYANPIGLDEPGNYSSAADLATLAIELRRDRLFRRIFDTPSAVLESGAVPRSISNRNTLLQAFPFVNGVKTGYTIEAGNVLVGSGEQKGVELVSAVLGAPSEPDRDSATLALLDYGFSLYHRRSPVKRGEPLASVAIHDRDLSIELTPSESLRITVRKGQRVQTSVDAPAEVDGPVRRGQRLGEVSVLVGGKTAGRVALVATASAEAASPAERVDAAVPGPRALAWVAVGGAVGLIVGAALAIRARRRQ